jgi:alpha/beta superfamily hydrolase
VHITCSIVAFMPSSAYRLFQLRHGTAGYGDSDGEPSEDGLVRDAVTVFNWIKQYAANTPVFVWGHSLGSALVSLVTSCCLSALLCQ